MDTAEGPVVPMQRVTDPIHPSIRIDYVHLRTAEIDRVRAFSVDVLDFDVIAEARDVPDWGATGDVTFLSAGGHTWKSKAGPSGRTGLHHVATAFSTRGGFADADRRLAVIDWLVRQAESEPAHDAISIMGLGGDTPERMRDRPAETRPSRYEGHQAIVFGVKLDPDALLDDLDPA